jgi:uncharacterized membrane protein YsdA (DUF1294 family)/cold shock CspA family protein
MRTSVRLAGRITDWNDAKGYGFVVPISAGERAFVHITDFQRGSRRPAAGDLISYLPTRDQLGRINAKEIRHDGQKLAPQRSNTALPRAVIGIAALVVFAALPEFGVIPRPLAAVVFIMSLVAFLMYWLDKSAAQTKRERTPENTLHLLSLAGGWPGALIAQQQFRHKTVKEAFQNAFWLTVILNVAGITWLVKTGLAAEIMQSLSS